MSEQPEHRLDPDQAADRVRSERGADRPPRKPPPVINTRPYRWMIGIFGIVLVVAISVYQFALRGVGGPGVPPGKHLHYFVAPLATSNLNLDANANPRCDPAHPNPEGLNVCGQTPLVLAFFAVGSADCKRQVDALQALSRQFSAGRVQFAAVAVRAGRAAAAAAVSSHHWTIPVAYDRDGAIGDLYGVSVCPMVELAHAGGIVTDRLIGDYWLTSTTLAPKVRALVGGS